MEGVVVGDLIGSHVVSLVWFPHRGVSLLVPTESEKGTKETDVKKSGEEFRDISSHSHDVDK